MYISTEDLYKQFEFEPFSFLPFKWISGKTST